MNVCKTKDNETRIHICDTQRERAKERAHARETSARARARESERESCQNSGFKTRNYVDLYCESDSDYVNCE